MGTRDEGDVGLQPEAHAGLLVVREVRPPFQIYFQKRI